MWLRMFNAGVAVQKHTSAAALSTTLLPAGRGVRRNVIGIFLHVATVMSAGGTRARNRTWLSVFAGDSHAGVHRCTEYRAIEVVAPRVAGARGHGGAVVGRHGRRSRGVGLQVRGRRGSTCLPRYTLRGACTADEAGPRGPTADRCQCTAPTGIDACAEIGRRTLVLATCRRHHAQTQDRP